MRRMRCKHETRLRTRLLLINGVHVLIERMERRMRQPRLIKMKNVHLAVQFRLDHFVVVDDAVVRGLRNRQNARFLRLVLDEGIGGDFLLNRLPLEFFFRDRSDDAVVVAGGHQKHRHGPRQRNGMQNRLMAVAVDDHDVARRHRVVPDDLVGRGRTVSHEEQVVAAENTCGILFGLRHRPRVIQQLPQFFHGIADVCAEHVFAEELVKHLPHRTL